MAGYEFGFVALAIVILVAVAAVPFIVAGNSAGDCWQIILFIYYFEMLQKTKNLNKKQKNKQKTKII